MFCVVPHRLPKMMPWGLRHSFRMRGNSFQTFGPPPLLRSHKVQQMEFLLAVGAGKLANDYLVFGNIEGKLRSPRAVSRAWKRVVGTKGLPKVTLHALRHTHASALIRAGVDILTISRRIDHSNPSVTLDVYGHLMQGADAAAASAIEGLLR